MSIFECTDCFKKFNKKFNFERHCKICSNKQERKERGINNRTCGFCKEVFTRSTGVKDHLISCLCNPANVDLIYSKRKRYHGQLMLVNGIIDRCEKQIARDTELLQWADRNSDNSDPEDRSKENYKFLTNRIKECDNEINETLPEKFRLTKLYKLVNNTYKLLK